MEFIDQIQDLALALGSSPWLLVIVFAVTVIDGVFPPVPSETIVISAAVLSAAGDGPHLGLLMLVAAAGALLGDLAAFTLGRVVPLHRLPLARRPRGRRALAGATAALERRGTALVVAGRFVPVGRVAINVGAGALRYRWSRYLPAAAAAGVLWAGYNALAGIGANSLVSDNPLLAVAVGIAGGLVLGWLIDTVLQRLAHTPPASGDTPGTPGSGSTPDSSHSSPRW